MGDSCEEAASDTPNNDHVVILSLFDTEQIAARVESGCFVKPLRPMTVAGAPTVRVAEARVCTLPHAGRVPMLPICTDRASTVVSSAQAAAPAADNQ